MENTTTANQSTEIPSDYKTAVAVGLKEIEVGLVNIKRNQAETDKLKIETREIAKRVERLLEAM